MEIMWDRIQALENHSKRNNVRLIGLKETFGTNGTSLGCVQKMLTEGLGLRADAEFAGKEKRGFIWEGCRLSVFPDMTKKLAEKRRTFTSVKRKLQEREVKYTLAFPATLRFKSRGKNLSFTTATKADKFIIDNNQGNN